MRITILLFLLPLFAISQAKKLDDGDYLVKGQTLSRLDQAAKKYIQCAVASDSIQQQFNILDSVRVRKDTMLINQQAQIFRLTNSRISLEGENMALKKENVDLKLQVKHEKKNAFWWKIFGLTAIGLGTFIATR